MEKVKYGEMKRQRKYKMEKKEIEKGNNGERKR